VKTDIIRSPFWETIRKKRINELDQYYALARATITAYTKPTILRAYAGAPSCKIRFAEAIIAGDDALLKTWRIVTEDSKSKNSDPDRLQRIFDEQMASPDRLKFALIDVMSFGWWNCANQFIEYDTTDDVEVREREFRKLFTRVREVQCDEP
jgi:hypothetical protein